MLQVCSASINGMSKKDVLAIKSITDVRDAAVHLREALMTLGYEDTKTVFSM